MRSDSPTRINPAQLTSSGLVFIVVNMACRNAWALFCPVCRFLWKSIINSEVAASGTCHNETTTLGTPTLRKGRTRPMIPSIVISHKPVSQALNTTKFTFKSKV